MGTYQNKNKIQVTNTIRDVQLLSGARSSPHHLRVGIEALTASSAINKI